MQQVSFSSAPAHFSRNWYSVKRLIIKRTARGGGRCAAQSVSARAVAAYLCGARGRQSEANSGCDTTPAAAAAITALQHPLTWATHPHLSLRLGSPRRATVELRTPANLEPTPANTFKTVFIRSRRDIHHVRDRPQFALTGVNVYCWTAPVVDCDCGTY